MDISTGGATQNLIKDGTDQTFMDDVIQESTNQVVLVDFWAPWCGPCKKLTPDLEQAVREAAGDVKLVKINIDENQGVAGQMGVRSVPTVIAFKDGQPIDGFQGAQSQTQLREFFKKLGSAGGLAEQIEAALSEAEQAFQQGDLSTAVSIYAQIAQASPENVDAIAGMARCQLALGSADQARSILDSIPEDQRKHPAVKSVLAALDLVGSSDDSDADDLAELAAAVQKSPDDLQARFDYAEALSANGRQQAAVDELLAILERDLDWNEGSAKAQLLKIFEAEGPKSEVTLSGRKRMSSLLFA